MAEPIWRFERFVLRPLWVLLVIVLVTALASARWWWCGGAVVGFLYIGMIGQGLHPLQSAQGLTTGPLRGSEAEAEYHRLSYYVSLPRVSNAYTQVGIFCGTALGALLWSLADWRWYGAVALAIPCVIIVGAALKYAFHTTRLLTG